MVWEFYSFTTAPACLLKNMLMEAGGGLIQFLIMVWNLFWDLKDLGICQSYLNLGFYEFKNSIATFYLTNYLHLPLGFITNHLL